MADDDIGAGGQGVGEVVGELRQIVAAGPAAAAVAAQVRSQDPVAARNECGLDGVPGAVVGNQPVDEYRGGGPVPGLMKF
jgi:hypothetical protein